MKTKRNAIEFVILTLVFQVLLFSANASAQNLLTNPDFETGDLTGWDLVNDGQTVGEPGIGAQSGDFAVNLTAPFDSVPEVSQGRFGFPTADAFPASPGDEFLLTGYMLTETALPAVGTGATFGLLKIVFEDADGNDLEPTSVSKGQFNTNGNPGVESLAFLDGDSPVNEWIFTEAQGVAPANTVSVAFFVLNVDFGNEANHPMWFDNISATQVLSGDPGDFDNDGNVDGHDFLTWQRDPNVGDLSDWQSGYGPLSAATAVPEPTSLAMLLGLGFLSTLRRGRRAR